MAQTPPVAAQQPRKRGGVRGRANDVDAHVGTRIRIRRVMLGKSQTDLAVDLGISFQQVQKCERGANRISAGKLHALTKALDVPVSFFFDDMGEDARPAPSAPELIDRKSLELQKAFAAVTDEGIRSAILDFVRSISRAKSAPLRLVA
jgi:transcriptional regulator with XRE-family HTH domain